jgi:hypothetical protein
MAMVKTCTQNASRSAGVLRKGKTMTESKDELLERLHFIEAELNKSIDAALNCMSIKEKAFAMTQCMFRDDFNKKKNAVEIRDKLIRDVFELNSIIKEMTNNENR